MAHDDANESRSRINTYVGRLWVLCTVLFLFLGMITYIKDHFEEREYAKSSCYVRTSRIGSGKCQGKRYYICYFPVWEIEYGVNGKENGTIMERRDAVRATHGDASERREQFQVK